MTVRLIATDLDGTLLRSDGSVSQTTRATLAAVQRAGVRVVFVTARPLRWMAPLWPLVGNRGLAVLSNGALLYDVETEGVLRVRDLPHQVSWQLIERIREAVPGCSFAAETLSGPVLEVGYPLGADDRDGDFPRGELADLVRAPIVKLLAKHHGDPERFRGEVISAVAEDALATWTMDGLMEISALGVTKAVGLADLCSRFGVGQHEVVAFGDMPNDLPMLAWAGSSYAVANAHPSVLAAAAHVAPANDDDGVAKVLVDLLNLTEPASLLGAGAGGRFDKPEATGPD